jgi:hypothetical protein
MMPNAFPLVTVLVLVLALLGVVLSVLILRAIIKSAVLGALRQHHDETNTAATASLPNSHSRP